MKKYFILFIFHFILTQFSFAQITVDQTELSDALKEKLMDEITGKITSSVQSGEKWVADATYFSVVLKPFTAFGIDPEDPNLINQANDIHKNILAELEKNPGLKYSSQLNTEIKGLVKNGLWNYASSYIDEDSKAIYSQVSDLISNGKDQISKLLDAADGISNLDPSSLDYESQVTATLKSYGFKSDYFDKIDDLDNVLSTGYEKLVDPISALYTICAAMDSDDPIEKIKILFELGKDYGGKVPIIGDLIVPLFTLAKGVLDAAIGLENVLEKNLNQGCINAEGGNFGAHKKGGKSYNFIKKFPNAGYVCPMNMGVYHPVYNNIYFSMDLDDADETYFLMNKVWLRGKNDKLHKGREDISKSIQWLRSNKYTEEATNLEFIFTAFQKEYGWSVYTEEVTKRIQRIKQLFNYSYTTVNHCEDSKLEKFYMDKMGFNWLKQLLATKDETTWNELKHFDVFEAPILNKMIYNYYMSKHQPNLERLDQIIKQFEEQMPVNIYGTVSYDNGTPIQGATLQVGFNSMFERKDPDHKIVTAPNGDYSYFLLMKINTEIGISVSVVTNNSEVKDEPRTVEPALKINAYEVNLKLPNPEPDIRANQNQNIANAGATTSNNPPTDPGTTPPIDISVQITNSDCAKDPHGIAEWDAVNQQVICSCEDFYTWDETVKKCVANVHEILANSDCSQWPNTEPKWDYSNNEPYCDCISGYEWNEDYTNCISKQEKLVAQTDCSQYPNSQPIWDPVSNEVICDCLPGFEWDVNYTKCISKALAEMQNFDCSMFPNTEAVWDPVSQQAFCDCSPGYEWNEEYTACEQIAQQQPKNDCSHLPNTRAIFDPVLNETVCDCLPGYQWNQNQTACIPIPKKPSVNWNNILAMTLDVMNAVNPNNQGLIPTSSGGSIQGMPQQATHHQSNCNDQQQSGGNAPEVHTIDLGQSFGSFIFDYDTETIKDQIIITNGGRTIFNTGCVGERKAGIRLNISGSPTISVRVNPNCDGSNGTSWSFTVHCPQN